jgi:hypothetical protein
MDTTDEETYEDLFGINQKPELESLVKNIEDLDLAVRHKLLPPAFLLKRGRELFDQNDEEKCILLTDILDSWEHPGEEFIISIADYLQSIDKSVVIKFRPIINILSDREF